MKRLLALALVLAMVSLGVPATAFAAAPQAKMGNGQVTGAAQNEAGSPIANATVRLRNTGTGDVVATSRTAADGGYSFSNLAAGNYVVELVDSNGAVIATSVALSLTTGSMSVSGVALTAAVGKAGVGAVGATGAGHFFTSTGGILLLAAVGAGVVVAVIGATEETSASK
jgi:hypothetical protein